MRKLSGMYKSFCSEREENFASYINGGDNLKEISEFLKSKLNADDYFQAEELLNQLINEVEEKGI